MFLLVYRLPFDASAPSWRRERRSVHLTNAALVHTPTMVLASIVGVRLFSVQHRFEEAQWARQEHWDPVRASLERSSYLRLPRVLQWFTANLGLHHVHHLSPRIPNYNLQRCHDENPIFHRATTITLRASLQAFKLNLWDEEHNRLVSFAALKTRQTQDLPVKA